MMKKLVLFIVLFVCLVIAQPSNDEEDDIEVGDIKLASRAIFTYTEGFGCIEGRESIDWCEEYAYGEQEINDKTKFYNLGERVFCNFKTTEHKPETKEPVHVTGIAGALWIEKSPDSPGYVVSGLLMSNDPVQEGVQIYGLEGKATRMYLTKFWKDGLFNFQRMEVKVWGEKHDELLDLVEDQVAPTLRKFKDTWESEEDHDAENEDEQGTEIL